MEPDHTITSKILGRDYQLYISYPKNYSIKDSISYPVLYLLDGVWIFPVFSGSKELLDYRNEIEELTIVGISASDLPFRSQDYSTSVSTYEDEKVGKYVMHPKDLLNL